MKNNKPFDLDKYLSIVSEQAKNAPEPEQILSEIENNDFSSFDPVFLKDEKQQSSDKSKELPPEANLPSITEVL